MERAPLAIVALFAALITIFVFFTGIESIGQLFGWKHKTEQTIPEKPPDEPTKDAEVKPIKLDYHKDGFEIIEEGWFFKDLNFYFCKNGKKYFLLQASSRPAKLYDVNLDSSKIVITVGNVIHIMNYDGRRHQQYLIDDWNQDYANLSFLKRRSFRLHVYFDREGGYSWGRGLTLSKPGLYEFTIDENNYFSKIKRLY